MIKKHKINIFPAAAVAILSFLTLPGCFTGIESTAKIKDKTSGKNKIELSPEELLLQSARPLTPQQWHEGKQFIVSQGRIELAFTPTSIAATLQPGDTLYFKGIAPAIRLSGDSVTDVNFDTNSGQKLTYRIDISPYKVLKSDRLDIPFTIDADVVTSTRQLLVGRNLWPLRPGSDGKRYNKVTVNDVIPGNSEYPLSIILSSGDTIKMLIEGQNPTSRIFSNLFSLSDPRKLYPQISDANWEMICQGRVLSGMTREECKLSLGAPASVERITAYNGLVEHWSYENGVYLNFLDGILTSFRE